MDGHQSRPPHHKLSLPLCSSTAEPNMGAIFNPIQHGSQGGKEGLSWKETNVSPRPGPAYDGEGVSRFTSLPTTQRDARKHPHRTSLPLTTRTQML